MEGGIGVRPLIKNLKVEKGEARQRQRGANGLETLWRGWAGQQQNGD